MTECIGQQLGNYRLVSLIGAGGFADVYLSEHIHLGTQAAIKVLSTSLGSEGIEQFYRESRTIARLEHPHIIRVLDFGVEEDGTPFLIMSYAPNGTLRQRHPKGSRVPLAGVEAYVKQVASALQYAHDQHVIHRDIKPENLLIGRNHEILLSDFGIALVTQGSGMQHTQDLAGTIDYMAPEQIQAHPCPNSDQYSLGVVVYEWLSGERPFHGSFTEVAAKHSSTPPPPLCEKVPALSPAVEQVVRIALAKDPKQRFATVQAFATALEQAGHTPDQEQAFLARSPHPVERGTLPKPSLTPPVLPVLMTPPSQPLSQSQMVTAMNPPPLGETPIPQAAPGLSAALEQNTLPPRPMQPWRKGLSRRTALIGLAGLVGVGALGATVAWLLRTQSAPTTTALPATPTAPTRSVIPNPTPTDFAGFGFDSQRTHFNPFEQTLSPTTVAHLKPYWTAKTGNTINSSPAVANGIVYLGSDDHKLYAFNATNGTLLWAVSAGDRVYSSPTVSKGVVYFGSTDGKFYALDATSGNPRWIAPIGNQIYSSPVVVNGIVYIGSTDGKLYAMNATTGAPTWSTHIGSRVNSSPTVANGIVYVGSADMQLYALDVTTGKVLWTAADSQDVLNSSPAVAGRRVYIGSPDGHLYAYNATSGKLLWSMRTYNQINSSPTVANGVVYTGSWDGEVYACDATTGKILWVGDTTDHIFSSAAVVNGVVYISSWDTKLYAFHLPSTQP